MSNVTTTPTLSRPSRARPLLCRGIYGLPNGDGLNSLVKLLIEYGLEELAKGNLDQQPSATPGAINLDATEEPVA